MLSKEEIEKAKKKLELMEYKYTLTNNDDKAIETLLQYIDQLEQEKVYPNNSCEGNGIPCWDCVKQYFEKKVEGK